MANQKKVTAKKQKNEKRNPLNKKLTLSGHLVELRYRLLISAVFFLTASSAAFIFRDRLLELISLPVNQLYFLSITGAFFAYIKLALAVGLAFSLPVFLLQFFLFISPALEKQRRVYFGWGISICLFLFYLGTAFAAALLRPATEFFLNFSSATLTPLPGINEYLSFASSLILGCGFAFELPVFVWVLARLGIINADQLALRWREAIIAILCVSAFITPGDPFSMIAAAIPLGILYTISISIAKKAGGGS